LIVAGGRTGQSNCMDPVTPFECCGCEKFEPSGPRNSGVSRLEQPAKINKNPTIHFTLNFKERYGKFQINSAQLGP
jgi:hypothetical protein